MRNLMRNLFCAACVLTLAACDGPLPFMAGGELGGEVGELPAPWQLQEDTGLAQLETRPDDPYSINLTYVQMNGSLYIYAGDTKSNWATNIEQDPLVRIKVNDVVYPARAVRVHSDDEITAFASIWVDRSTFQRDPLGFDEVWLYRLESR